MKELLRASDIAEAQVICSFLKANGIAAQIPDEITATNLHHMTPALGGVRIFVPPAQYTEAQELLKSHRQLHAVEETGAPTEERNIQAVEALTSKALRLAVFGVFMFPLVLNFYSLYLCFAAISSAKDFTARARRNYLTALMFNIVGLSAWGYVAYKSLQT